MAHKLGAGGGFVVAVAAAVLAMMADPAAAARCSTKRPSGIEGGLKAQCPSIDDPGLPSCPAGSTRVVYRLDQPFPLDGATSSATVASTPTSPCAGAGPSVDLTPDSYVIGCWSPTDDRGCRKLRFLNNGSICLHLDGKPLGCGGAGCADLSIEQVAISTAGGADRMLCQPLDPTTSCHSARVNGREQFRVIIGGFCTTMGLSGNGDTENACKSEWGGTWWGYDLQGAGNAPLGDYDWATGAFKLVTFTGLPQCDALRACLGNGRSAPWTITIVGVPDDRVPGNVPPCLNDPTAPACQALGCF